MQLVALNWLTYQLTGSPLMLGLINFVALLPVGLLALVGGVISDRVPRRKLILITQTVLAGQAFILTLLAWFNLIEIWHIMVVTFLVSAMDVIEQPARFAFLMEIVGKEDFTSAVGLNSSMVNIARFVGPAIAGVFMSEFGEASCFFVNFITYLTVIGAFALMDTPLKPISRQPLKLKADLLEGLKYIWQNHTIKAVLSLIFIPVFLSQPYITLLPVFARDIFHTELTGVWLVSEYSRAGSGLWRFSVEYTPGRGV
jgi:MFS family permease